MISEAAAKYLWDARRAATRIARFTAGRSYGDYLADEMLRSAVERPFEIIREAFAGLRRADPELAARVPDLPRIVAFRNVLIHGYATVDDRLVWGVVEGRLAELLEVLVHLLDEAGDSDPGEP
ncbi:MAG: HepT-like ribonuclease domain-containing protein [Acetobacteraceae bacterium]